MKLLQQKVFDQSFYRRDTAEVARNLLGAVLIRVWKGKILAGIITETEAYGGSNDPASHAYIKKTHRNQAMFGEVGCVYVYFIYGNHYCLNIVARSDDMNAGAVLIRSIIPIVGIEKMRVSRGRHVPDIGLTNGPGKICQALQLTCSFNYYDMTKQGDLYITDGIHIAQHDIESTTRIGISRAQNLLWRYIIKWHNSSFN